MATQQLLPEITMVATFTVMMGNGRVVGRSHEGTVLSLNADPGILSGQCLKSKAYKPLRSLT